MEEPLKGNDLIPFSALTEQTHIGGGGFGDVFKAKLSVAVKVLYTDDSASLLKEIRIMQKCRSPYVVKVLEVCAGEKEQLGLVMEYMEMGSLANMLKTNQEPPPWAFVVKVANQVAHGIQFLHNRTPCVLHLDLKPDNVLLDNNLNAKLTDFGLSREVRSRSFTTKSNKNGGTIAYLPPEAFEEEYSASKATDIYSFSILLWSLVTGKKPYEGSLTTLLGYRVGQGDRPLLKDIDALEDGRPGLDDLKALMESCWDGKKKERPSADVCAEKTEELHQNHKDPDTVAQLLEKLKLQDNRDAMPATSGVLPSYNHHGGPPAQDVRDGETKKSEAKAVSTSNSRNPNLGATINVKQVIGGQFGDHNQMHLHTQPENKSESESEIPLLSREGKFVK